MTTLNRFSTRLALIFVALVVIPLIIVTVIVSQQSVDYLRSNVDANLQERVARITIEVESFVAGRTSILLYMAEVNGLTDDEQSALINGLLAFDTAFQEIAVLDATGMEMARVSRSDIVFQDELHSRADSTAYTAVAAGEAVYYSIVRFDDALREPLMTIALPINDKRTGELKKVLIADFRFRAIWELLGTLDYRPGETAYMLDEAEEVIAHRNPSLVLQNTLFPIPPGPTGRFTGLSGDEVLYAVEQVNFGNQTFFIVAEQSVTEALSLASDIQIIATVVLVVSLLIVAVLAAAFIRSVTTPVYELSRAVETLAAGDLSSRARVNGPTELASLGRSFNAMADQLNDSISELENTLSELRSAQHDLSEKHAELDRFFTLSVDLMCIARSTDGTFVKVNKAFETVLGYPADEIEGRNFEDFLHPDDVQPTQAATEKLQDQEPIGLFTNRYRTADGTYRLLEWHSQPYGDLVFAAAQDVTERRKGEELALQVEALKARFVTEQERGAFVKRMVSSLSHDLRTPLAVISTAKDLLSRYYDQLSLEKRKEKLDSIERQLQFAKELLDDTVSVIQGNLNEREFAPQVINLAALCEVSVQEISETRHVDQRVHFENQDGIEYARIDETLVTRMLLNLLSNAIKYSPDGGEVRLELSKQGQSVVLRVIDHGMGITEEELPFIFDPFFRADDVTKMQGTGLGLSIVKNCVDRHQGTIHAESVVGEGSTFTIQLPSALANISDQPPTMAS